MFLPAIWILAPSLVRARVRRSCNFVLLMLRLVRWKSYSGLDGRAFSCTKPSVTVWRPTSIVKRRRHLPVLLDKRWDRSFAPLLTTAPFRSAETGKCRRQIGRAHV